ncbi:hypothetical protein C8F01DRAFT_1134514 [Mycena amicta]|nr:hypothetical protein C8F01DRAFT_1134514 [Mycena amicta]
MATISSLPPELTTHIFLFCPPSDDDAVPKPHTAPLLLAQICRRWRAIALGTSALWRSLDLRFKPHAISTDRPPWATSVTMDPLLELWLGRARGRSLSLVLRHFPRRSVVEILRRFPNIEHLTVEPKDRLEPFIPPVTAPRLESLTLVGGQYSNQLLDALTAPALVRLHPSSRLMSPILRFLSQSGCTLMHLSINVTRGTSQTDLVNLLRSLTSLTSLKVNENRTRWLIGRCPPILLLLLEQQVVPNLKNLVVNTWLTGHDHLAFIRLISQRFVGGSSALQPKLESVHLELVQDEMEHPDECDKVDRIHARRTPHADISHIPIGRVRVQILY